MQHMMFAKPQSVFCSGTRQNNYIMLYLLGFREHFVNFKCRSSASVPTDMPHEDTELASPSWVLLVTFFTLLHKGGHVFMFANNVQLLSSSVLVHVSSHGLHTTRNPYWKPMALPDIFGCAGTDRSWCPTIAGGTHTWSDGLKITANYGLSEAGLLLDLNWRVFSTFSQEHSFPTYEL